MSFRKVEHDLNNGMYNVIFLGIQKNETSDICVVFGLLMVEDGEGGKGVRTEKVAEEERVKHQA